MYCQPIRYSRVIDAAAHRRTLLAATLALAAGLHVHSAQATTLNVADDTEVLLERNTAPRGAVQSLRVRATGTETKQTFVRFDLAGLPNTLTGANIEAATAKLWISRVDNPGNLAVHRVLGDWNEETLTLNNSPEIDNEFARVAVTSAAARQYLSVDVTPLVREWIDGAANNGFTLVPDNGTDVTLDSKENTATSHPMEIDLVVRIPGPPIRRERSVSVLPLGNAPQIFQIDCLAGELARSGGWEGGQTVLNSGPVGNASWSVTVAAPANPPFFGTNIPFPTVTSGVVFVLCQGF